VKKEAAFYSDYRNRISISPVTIKQVNSFEKKFEVASKAGYKGIGLRYNEIKEYLEQGHTIGDVMNLRQIYGLEFTEVAFLAEWQYWNGIPLICKRSRKGKAYSSSEEQLGELRLFFETCRALNCKYVTAVPAMEETGDLREAVKDFRKLCNLAEGYKVNICLEFMGSAPQVNNIKTAWEIIKETACSNSGIVLDTFLFYQGKSCLEDLEPIPVEKIMIVHVADAKNKPPEKLDMLKDRLFPGEGVIPIKEILILLRQKDYSGFYTLEIFNEEYWERDPLIISKKGYKSISKLLTEVK